MVLAFLLPFGTLFRTLKSGITDPEFRAVLFLAGLQVTIATVFYRLVEDWEWLDALYFSVVSVTTVGYGDFTPETALGKVFTMLYLLLGVGLFVALNSRIAAIRVAARAQKAARSGDADPDAPA